MHVILVNRYFYPDHAPTGVLLSDVAFALSRAGVKVTVITSRLRYDGGDLMTPGLETINGVDVFRVWTSQSSRRGLFDRALGYSSFYLTASWHLWRLARDADIVVAATDPPLLSVLAATIAKLRGTKTITWLQDIFPEIAEALDVGGGFGRFMFRAVRPLRNWSLHRARTNVVVGDAMAAHLLEEGIEPSKVCTIPNWTDGEHIKPIAPAQNGVRKAFGLEGRFAVLYAGNLGRAHDVDTLLDAITVLQDQALSDPIAAQVMFVFVGGGIQHARLREEIGERGLRNVQIHPYQPTERLPETLGAADLHIVSLNPKLEGLVVPSKFYGIAAAGRPTLFVGAQDGEIANLLQKNACGLSVLPGDAPGLAARVLELARDPQGCARMGQRARSAFEAHWSKKRALNRWVRLLEDSVRSPSHRP